MIPAILPSARTAARAAALAAPFALLLALAALSVRGQPPGQNLPPAPAPAPGAAPAPVVRASTEEIIPLSESPEDPSASPEERLRRQKVIIMKRIEQRQKMLEEAQRKADEAAAANPNAVPTPTPLPGEMAVPPPPPPKPNKPAASVTMFLTPATVTARTGERFTTQCDLLNPDHLRVDGVEIVLSYPAQCLRLAGIHQDKIRPMIAGDPVCLIDEDHGTVFYKIRLLRPVNALAIPTVVFVWEAIAPVDDAEILLTAGQRVSRAMSGRKLLSVGQEGPRSAVLGTFVRIDPAPGAVPPGDRFLDLGNVTLRQAGFRDQSRLRPPRLWIRQPQDEELQPGRWILVDIGVDNPDRVVFDEVRLAAHFDPDLVEIADSDRGNWISEGLNLLDGPFHQEWPWDRHFKNQVDPARGFFIYRMAMGDLREQPSGTLVRLFARVRRPTTGPLFTWLWGDDKDPDALATGLYLFNVNLYRKLLDAPAAPLSDLSAGLPSAELTPGADKADPALYREKKTGEIVAK